MPNASERPRHHPPLTRLNPAVSASIRHGTQAQQLCEAPSSLAPAARPAPAELGAGGCTTTRRVAPLALRRPRTPPVVLFAPSNTLPGHSDARTPSPAGRISAIEPPAAHATHLCCVLEGASTRLVGAERVGWETGTNEDPSGAGRGLVDRRRPHVGSRERTRAGGWRRVREREEGLRVASEVQKSRQGGWEASISVCICTTVTRSVAK